MPTISVRVDDEMKQRMDELEAVNWSAVLRTHIEQVLNEYDINNRDLARAVLLTEQVYGSVLPEDINEWDSADHIRQDRERTFTQRRAAELIDSENESEDSES